MKTEIIPVVWPDDLRIAGAVERKFAHQFGIPHLTVLLIVVRTVDAKLAVYVRSAKQSFAGSTDIFGGHCAADSATCLTSGTPALESLIRETAMREANEELRMSKTNGTSIVFDTENAEHTFRQVGEFGQFTVDTPQNVERSTLFLVKLSEGISINPCDEIDGEVIPVQVEWLSLDELLADYQQQRRPFADGAGRVLKLANDDAQFRRTIEHGIRSLADTIEPSHPIPRKSRMKAKREGTLILLTCHCVFDVPTNRCLTEHSADRPIYEAQLVYAFRHLVWRASKSPLLVITGGRTKTERDCSESRSYIEMANAMNLNIPANVTLEEHALTSIENVLLSLYAYHQARGAYPESIDAISWEFKRERFERTLDAISRWQPLGETWPTLNFFPVGDLSGAGKANALRVERDYIKSLTEGLEGYYRSSQTQDILQKRDVHHSRPVAKEFYSAYPLPF